MSKPLKKIPLLCVIFVMCAVPLCAGQNNPVLDEARKLLPSFPPRTSPTDNEAAEANLSIQATQILLDGRDKPFRESFEAAKRLLYGDGNPPLESHDIMTKGMPAKDYELSRTFTKIIDRILPEPENADTYDEILEAEDGYLVFGRILGKCYAAGKNDILCRVFEKYYERQTDPEIRQAMRLHLKRYRGGLEKAGELVGHIKSEELRQSLLDDIRADTWEYLLNSLTYYGRNEHKDRVPSQEKSLMRHYSIDSAEWEKRRLETWLRFIEDARDARKDSPYDYVRGGHPRYLFGIYLMLIRQYRLENPDATMESDEMLRRLITDALEMVEQSRERSKDRSKERDEYYGVYERLSEDIFRYDDKDMLNRFADIMIAHDYSPLPTITLLYRLDRAEEAKKIYADALKSVTEEETSLSKKIYFLRTAEAFYRRTDHVAETEALAEKVMESLYPIADRTSTEKKITAGYLGFPFVKKMLDRGDFVAVVSFVSQRSDGGDHNPTLWVARGYAHRGDYARAIEIGEFGQSGECGMRGYVADVMFQHGKTEEAEKLLDETVQAVDAGKMKPHRDLIVSLVLHRRTDEAVRISTSIPVEGEYDWDWDRGLPTDYKRDPVRILQTLLVNDREAEAMKLIDEWKDPRGKAWGIWTLCRWNQEEFLRKDKPSLFTPEWKKRWTEFLVNYADTLEEPFAWYRVDEWNNAAECLIAFGEIAAAVKVLDKVPGIMKEMEPPGRTGDPYSFRSPGVIPVLNRTGLLLTKAGEREKADVIFVHAVRVCADKPENGKKSTNLMYTLVEYEICKNAESPEQIRVFPGFGRRNVSYTPMRELWKRNLFMNVSVA